MMAATTVLDTIITMRDGSGLLCRSSRLLCALAIVHFPVSLPFQVVVCGAENNPGINVLGTPLF